MIFWTYDYTVWKEIIKKLIMQQKYQQTCIHTLNHLFYTCSFIENHLGSFRPRSFRSRSFRPFSISTLFFYFIHCVDINRCYCLASFVKQFNTYLLGGVELNCGRYGDKVFTKLLKIEGKLLGQPTFSFSKTFLSLVSNHDARNPLPS